MAKARRTNSATDAIGGLLDLIGTTIEKEFKDDPEGMARAKKQVTDIKDSNLTTAMEHLDDNIETRHQVDEVLEAGGVDPVQHGRDNALAGAEMVVEFEQARIAEPTEQDEPTEPTEVIE